MSTIPPVDPARPDPGHEHPQVTLVHPATGERVEVDEQLAPLVAALWRAGAATFYSCQLETVFVPLDDQRMRWGVNTDEDDDYGALIGWDALEAPVAQAVRAYIIGDQRTVHLLLAAAASDAAEVLEGDPDDVPLALIVRGCTPSSRRSRGGRFLVHFPCWAIPVLTAAVEQLAPAGLNRAQRRRDARRKGRGR